MNDMSYQDEQRQEMPRRFSPNSRTTLEQRIIVDRLHLCAQSWQELSLRVRCKEVDSNRAATAESDIADDCEWPLELAHDLGYLWNRLVVKEYPRWYEVAGYHTPVEGHNSEGKIFLWHSGKISTVQSKIPYYPIQTEPLRSGRDMYLCNIYHEYAVTCKVLAHTVVAREPRQIGRPKKTISDYTPAELYCFAWWEQKGFFEENYQSRAGLKSKRIQELLTCLKSHFSKDERVRLGNRRPLDQRTLSRMLTQLHLKQIAVEALKVDEVARKLSVEFSVNQ